MEDDWADFKASKLIKENGFALWEGELAQALRDERASCAMEATLMGRDDIAEAIRKNG